MKWQSKVDKILSKVSNKNSIPKGQLDFMVKTYFKNMKEKLQQDNMPTVMVHGFGEFRGAFPKLKRKLKKLDEAKEEGTIDEETYKKEKAHYQKVLNRLQKEKTTRNDKKK